MTVKNGSSEIKVTHGETNDWPIVALKFININLGHFNLSSFMIWKYFIVLHCFFIRHESPKVAVINRATSIRGPTKSASNFSLT